MSSPAVFSVHELKHNTIRTYAFVELGFALLQMICAGHVFNSLLGGHEEYTLHESAGFIMIYTSVLAATFLGCYAFLLLEAQLGDGSVWTPGAGGQAVGYVSWVIQVLAMGIGCKYLSLGSKATAYEGGMEIQKDVSSLPNFVAVLAIVNQFLSLVAQTHIRKIQGAHQASVTGGGSGGGGSYSHLSA